MHLSGWNAYRVGLKMANYPMFPPFSEGSVGCAPSKPMFIKIRFKLIEIS